MIVLKYLQCHKKTLFLFFLCLAIFSMVFYLSNLPLDAVLYSGLLCLVVIALCVTYDFYVFFRQHKDLQKLMDVIDAQVDRLPQPRSLVEQDYTQLINVLYGAKKKGESQAYIQRKELMDYFTLWTHQIKTPIAAMDLLLQSKGKKITEEKKNLSMELFRIEEYVNVVMSYLRVEDMASDLAFEEVELDELIRETLRKYSQVFIGSKISVDFVKTECQLITDSKWLAIVLGQLLSNALKYTPEGGTIYIYMVKEMLIIQDTGIGIRETDLPRIFEKGFTGYNGRQYSKSSGQGLYLCKTIMSKLSFKIKIVSEEDGGTKAILDFSKEPFNNVR